MERYSSRIIDEYGRISLHDELRKKLNLETNTKVTLHPIGKIVILQKANTENISQRYLIETIDESGNISLPEKLLKFMDWETNDMVAVYHVDDNMLILKLIMWARTGASKVLECMR